MKTFVLYSLAVALVIVLIVSGGALIRTLGENSTAPLSVKKTAPLTAAKPGKTSQPPAPAMAGGVVSVPSDEDEDSPAMGSPLAANLNAPKGTPQQDVDTLHELVLQYQHNMRHRNALPIGDDSDLVRALTGRNPLGFVVIPPNHPAISDEGRLLDRWGTPYFVHPISAATIDIRSAGPDKKMFTADDLVASP